MASPTTTQPTQVAVIIGFEAPVPAVIRRRMELQAPVQQSREGLWRGPVPTLSAWAEACRADQRLPFLLYLMLEQAGWLQAGIRIHVELGVDGFRIRHPLYGSLATPTIARADDHIFSLTPRQGEIGSLPPEVDPVSAGYARFDIQRLLPQVVEADLDHCRRLLAAHPVAASTWLLGAPSGRRGAETGASRRLSLGTTYFSEGHLTDLGIIRLHAEAGVLIRPADRRRQQRLTAFRRHARQHWLAVRREVSRMQQAGSIPLGIEFSATAAAIEARWHRIPDAVCVDSHGDLIWIEVARKSPARMAEDDRFRYEQHVPEICACVASALDRPVHYHLHRGQLRSSYTFKP